MRTWMVALVGVALCSAVIGAQTPDPAKVKAGEALYVKIKCSTCHAIKGEGGKLSTDLSGISAKMSEADIKTWISKPETMEPKLPKKPVMPMSTYMKTQKITDADVDALVAYVRSLK